MHKCCIQAAGCKTQDKDIIRLREACQEFEAIFTYYLIKEMHKSIPKADLFHVKNIEGFYNSLLYEQMAREVAQGGGIGLANLLLNEFKMNILEKRDDSKEKD